MVWNTQPEGLPWDSYSNKEVLDENIVEKFALGEVYCLLTLMLGEVYCLLTLMYYASEWCHYDVCFIHEILNKKQVAAVLLNNL